MSEEKIINGFVLPKTRTKKQQVNLELSGNGLSEERRAEFNAELKSREEENKANPPEK